MITGLCKQKSKQCTRIPCLIAIMMGPGKIFKCCTPLHHLDNFCASFIKEWTKKKSKVMAAL